MLSKYKSEMNMILLNSKTKLETKLYMCPLQLMCKKYYLPRINAAKLCEFFEKEIQDCFDNGKNIKLNSFNNKKIIQFAPD